MGEVEIKIKVQHGRKVKKKSFKRYISSPSKFSQFFDDLIAEMNVVIEEISKRW